MKPILRSARAGEFARTLEEYLPSSGEPTSEVSPEWQHYLNLANQISALPQVNPRPEFTVALRAQLLNDQANELPQPVRSVPRNSQKRLAVALSASIVLGAPVGVAVAAEGSLPGQGLYPIKRSLESIKQVEVFNPDLSVTLFDQAQTRLTEVRGLVNQGADNELVLSVLTEFEETITAAETELSDTSDLNNAADIISNQLHTLIEINAIARPELHPYLVDTSMLLREIQTKILADCTNCETATTPLELSQEEIQGISDIMQAITAKQGAQNSDSSQSKQPEAIPNNLPKNSEPAPTEQPSPTPTDTEITPEANPLLTADQQLSNMVNAILAAPEQHQEELAALLNSSKLDTLDDKIITTLKDLNALLNPGTERSSAGETSLPTATPTASPNE